MMGDVKTEHDVEQLGKRIQDMLDGFTLSEDLGFRLTVSPDRQEDDWSYWVVVPDREDVRVVEYVEALMAVERKLRKEGRNVLLVPALGDD